MTSTAQQIAISNAQLGGITKVVAYAGTGKTTTLEALSKTQAKRGLSSLYLAFNKGAEQEAKNRFPRDWVTVKTINGLAHGLVSPRYKAKFRPYSLKSIEVIKLMGLSWNWLFAKTVLDTLNYWCSSDLEVFPTSAESIQGAPMGTPDMLRYAAVVAMQLWHRMIDLHDEVPISHDGILKIYQLSKPKLSYPYVMLDEAQDTNRVTWDILKRQTAPLVIVGDPYQSIYQFRGAYNAMDDVVAQQSFPLTQSFRFGQDVADIANTLLWGFYSETTPLEGLGPNTRVGPIDPAQPHAVISRTNAAIFTQAVVAMPEGKKIGFIGGVLSYNFGKIIDAWFLRAGEKSMIKDSFLKDFNNFEDLAEYATSANDMEIKRTIEAIQIYGSEVIDIVPALHAACVTDLSKAHITFSTAHKCKGATLRSVRLANDFPSLLNDYGEMLGKDVLDRQEVNLLYVAITRATHDLQLNNSTLKFLETMEMDVDRFSNDPWTVQHAVDVTPPKLIKTPAAPAPAIPKSWLPENGQLPGTFFLESPKAVVPAQAPSNVLAEVPTAAKKKFLKNQFDLFS